jgi:ABC-2 type transport system permease protein
VTNFTGTWTLVQIALRRDRVQLSAWVVGLAAMMFGFANVLLGVFNTDQEVAQTIGTFAGNPVMRAFGIASGASLGSLLMLRTLGLFVILAGLMSAMAVVRHTRQNEETRRTEWIASGVLGRHAGLAAALIVVLFANVALGALIALVLRLNDLPLNGAIAAGAAIAGAGMAFAGLAAIAAQVSESSRGATGIAAMGIGAAYLLSAAGNVIGSIDEGGFVVLPAWPSWLSPLGWAQLVRPFGGDHWAMLLPLCAFAVAAAAVALLLESRRDVGRGLIPERRGPAEAPRALLSPLGLAWRLQRGTLLAWAIGVTVFGSVFGAVSNAFDDIVRDVEEAAELFARIGGTEQLTDAFYATIIGLMALVVGTYTVGALLRLRSEEADGLLEPVLATTVTRWRWLLGHLVIVAFGTLLLLGLTGVSAGLFAGLAVGDVPGMLGTLTGAALVHAPAVLLLGAIVVAAFGVLPRCSGGIAWVAFFGALVAGPMIGGLLDLPEAVRNLSPFTHVPAIPAEPFTLLPVLVLTGVVLALAAVGASAFARRDLVLQAESARGGLPLLGRLRPRPAATMEVAEEAAA